MKKLLTISLFLMIFAHIFSQTDRDTIQLDELTVTGTKYDIARNQVPLTISLLNKSVIESSNETSVLPLLSEEIPGLFITERSVAGYGVADGAAGQISIRGLGGSPTTGVLVLIDGHPQFMGLMGHHLPDMYVTSDLEKVEVIRGPGSVLYGTNAIGGVVNLITKKHLTDGVQASGGYSLGSFNTQKFVQSVSYRKNKLTLVSSLNYTQSDGHRDSSEFNITNAFVKGSWAFSDKIKATADYSIARFESADPGLDTGKVILAGERIDILRGRTSLSLENDFHSFSGALKMYYNYGVHDISDGWHSVDDMWGIMIYQGIKLTTSTQLTAGYDYIHYGGKGSPIIGVTRTPEGPVFGPSKYNNTWLTSYGHAVYALVQQEIGNMITLNGGVRYDKNNLFDGEFIPQGGIVFRPEAKISLKAMVSKGYRPPSIRELYLFPVANEELNPEKLMNYELGYSHDLLNNRLSTELNLFYTSGDNLIRSVSPPFPPRYMNSGEIRNTGVEAQVRFRISEHLSAHSNYTFIHMENPLVATPRQNFFFSTRYNKNKFGIVFKLNTVQNLYGQAGQQVQLIEDGYTTIGLRGSYNLTENIYLSLSGENLTGAKYFNLYGYPMPGANFIAGIHYRLLSGR